MYKSRPGQMVYMQYNITMCLLSNETETPLDLAFIIATLEPLLVFHDASVLQKGQHNQSAFIVRLHVGQGTFFLTLSLRDTLPMMGKSSAFSTSTTSCGSVKRLSKCFTSISPCTIEVYIEPRKVNGANMLRVNALTAMKSKEKETKNCRYEIHGVYEYVQEGLPPRFNSPCIYDFAANHIVARSVALMMNCWVIFKRPIVALVVTLRD